jgi:ricin-type beta-trefoil lectin protein
MRMRKFGIMVGLALLGAVFMPNGTASASPAAGQLRSNLAPLCLDAESISSGAAIRLRSCSDSTHQSVIIDGSIESHISVQSKCFDVEGGATNPGARVQVWTCNGTGAQMWGFIPVANSGGYYLIQNIASRLCLVANQNGASLADCTPNLNPAGTQSSNLYVLGAQG